MSLTPEQIAKLRELATHHLEQGEEPGAFGEPRTVLGQESNLRQASLPITAVDYINPKRNLTDDQMIDTQEEPLKLEAKLRALKLLKGQ